VATVFTDVHVNAPFVVSARPSSRTPVLIAPRAPLLQIIVPLKIE